MNIIELCKELYGLTLQNLEKYVSKYQWSDSIISFPTWVKKSMENLI